MWLHCSIGSSWKYRSSESHWGKHWPTNVWDLIKRKIQERKEDFDWSKDHLKFWWVHWEINGILLKFIKISSHVLEIPWATHLIAFQRKNAHQTMESSQSISYCFQEFDWYMCFGPRAEDESVNKTFNNGCRSWSTDFKFRFFNEEWHKPTEGKDQMKGKWMVTTRISLWYIVRPHTNKQLSKVWNDTETTRGLIKQPNIASLLPLSSSKQQVVQDKQNDRIGCWKDPSQSRPKRTKCFHEPPIHHCNHGVVHQLRPRLAYSKRDFYESTDRAISSCISNFPCMWKSNGHLTKIVFQRRGHAVWEWSSNQGADEEHGCEVLTPGLKIPAHGHEQHFPTLPPFATSATPPQEGNIAAQYSSPKCSWVCLRATQSPVGCNIEIQNHVILRITGLRCVLGNAALTYLWDVHFKFSKVMGRQTKLVRKSNNILTEIAFLSSESGKAILIIEKPAGISGKLHSHADSISRCSASKNCVHTFQQGARTWCQDTLGTPLTIFKWVGAWVKGRKCAFVEFEASTFCLTSLFPSDLTLYSSTITISEESLASSW